MEETISLKEIFGVLKKRLLLILTLVVGAAIISAIISYFILTPTYQAKSQFIVNQNSTQSESVNINDVRFNIEVIKTYTDIIKSTRILDQVVEELNLDMSAGALSEKISVSSGDGSQLVTVTVTDIDPHVAADIANTTVEVFQEEVPTLMNIDNINTLSPAEVGENPQPVNPKPLLNIAIAIVLGGMVGVGLAFLLEYLDNTVKTEQDIEDKLQLPVLGVISHVTENDMAVSHFNPALNRRGRGDLNGQKTQKSV